jgi:hypothetical protein
MAAVNLEFSGDEQLHGQPRLRLVAGEQADLDVPAALAEAT